MGDRHLFLGNLCNVTMESLREYCEKFGTITDLQLNRDKEKNIYHCFAFVTYQNALFATQFMQKRPHLINNERIFVKRALSRITASIPERLVVTNRLVLSKAYLFDKQILRNYFLKFGHIRIFDYERGIIDYDDYDDVDRILIARPHYIQEKIIVVSKFIPKQPEDIEEHIKPTELNTVDDEEEEGDDYKMKYFLLEKQFEEYQHAKEKEIEYLRKELQHIKEDLSDITQIKLDKLIKNQQIFHNQLLLRTHPDYDTVHAQMCEDFLRSTPNKKHRSTKTFFDHD